MEPKVPHRFRLLEVTDGLEFPDFTGFRLVRRPPEPEFFTVSPPFIALSAKHERVQHLAREEQHDFPVSQRPRVGVLPVGPKRVKHVRRVNAHRAYSTLHVSASHGNQFGFRRLVPLDH